MWLIEVLYAIKNQGLNSKEEKVISHLSPALFETNRKTLPLIKVMNAKKRNLLGFIGPY